MNVTLGKYVPYNSWVHRLDPRVKIFATIALMVAIFFSYSFPDGTIHWAMTFGMAGVLFILISILMAATRVTVLTVLKSLRSLWFMVIFLSVIYVLVPKANPTLGVAWNWNGWIVYWDSFAEAGRIFARLVLMIMLTTVLTASTKPLDLTYALEWYMTPLKVLHFPAAEVAMTISIALRFIPTLLEDADRVMKAQSSRGVDFQHGKLWAKITGITSLVIPLFVSSFLRSEELANAMECRCYDPRAKRTRYRAMKARFGDFLAFFVSALVLTGIILVSVLHLDLFQILFGVVTA